MADSKFQPSPGSDIFLRPVAALEAESSLIASSNPPEQLPQLTALQLNETPPEYGPERVAWFQATKPGPRSITTTPFWLGIRATNSEVFILLAAIKHRLDKEGIIQFGKGEEWSTDEEFDQLARQVRAHESFKVLVVKVLTELPFFIAGYDKDNGPPWDWTEEWISSLLVETALHPIKAAPEMLAGEAHPFVLGSFGSSKDKGKGKVATSGISWTSARQQVSAHSGKETTTTSAIPKPPTMPLPLAQPQTAKVHRKVGGGYLGFKRVQKFKLSVMSEDRTREVNEAEIYAEDCLAPGRNSYHLKSIREEFEKKVNEDWCENGEESNSKAPLDLARGQFGYETGATRKVFKPITNHADLGIALAKLSQNITDPEEWTVQFTFYPEDSAERRNREASDMAKARLRIAGKKKTAEQPVDISTSSNGKAPDRSGGGVLPFARVGVETPRKTLQKPASPGTKEASVVINEDLKKLIAKDTKGASYKTPTGSLLEPSPIGSIKEPKPAIKTSFESDSKRDKVRKAISKVGQRFGVQKSTDPTETAGRAKPSNTPGPAPPKRSERPSILKKTAPETPRTLKPSFKPPSQPLSKTPTKASKDDANIQTNGFTIISHRTYRKGGNADFAVPVIADENSILQGSAGDTSSILEAGSEDGEIEAETNSEITGQEFLANQLQQLVNSPELTHMPDLKDPSVGLADWIDFCQMFKLDPDNRSTLSLITVKGLKTRLYPYQIHGTYWQMKNSRAVGGGIVADEMGLGKSLSFLAYITVERQLSMLYLRMEAARGLGSKKHHKEGASDAYLPCPSEGERPEWILCPCSTSSPTHKMKPKPGVRLAVVPPPLVKSWIREWDKHINDDLNMRLIVVHPPAFPISGVPDVRDATRSNPNTKILSSKRSRITATNRIEEDLPAPEQERILLLASRQYYYEYIKMRLEYQPKTNFKDKEVLKGIPKNPGIVFGISMVDESHEGHWKSPLSKKEKNNKSSILTDLPATNFPYLWGYTGTPLVTSPRGLESILFAIEHRVRNTRISAEEADSDWKTKPELGLSQFAWENLDDICTTYENWVKNDMGFNVMPDLRSLVLPFLKRFLIRRTAESNWFGSPLIRLRPHYHNDIALVANAFFNEDFKTYHERYAVPAQGLAITEAKARFLAIPAKERLMKALFPPPPKTLNFPQYWAIARKERIFATFPYLLQFALAPPGPRSLSFDREETRKWNSTTQYKNSLYWQNIANIINTSPKVAWLTEWLTEWKKVTQEKYGEVLESETSPEIVYHYRSRKLVIATQFDVIALVLDMYFKKYQPLLARNTRLILSTTAPRKRAVDLRAFFSDSNPGKSQRERDTYVQHPPPDAVNIIIGNAQIIGKGLNLTRATSIILMEPDISFARESQIYSRIHRIGQQAIETQSYRLWCESARARIYPKTIGPIWESWEWEGQAVERVLNRGLTFGKLVNEEKDGGLGKKAKTKIMIDSPSGPSSRPGSGGSDPLEIENEEDDDENNRRSSINVDPDTGSDHKRGTPRQSLTKSSVESAIEKDSSSIRREFDRSEERRLGLARPVSKIPKRKTKTTKPQLDGLSSENDDSEASASEISPLSKKREKARHSNDDESWPVSSKVRDKPTTQSLLDGETRPEFSHMAASNSDSSSTKGNPTPKPKFFQDLWGNKPGPQNKDSYTAQPVKHNSPIVVEDVKKVDFRRFTAAPPIDARTGGEYVESSEKNEHDEQTKQRLATVERLRELIKVVGKNRFEAFESEEGSSGQRKEEEDDVGNRGDKR